MSCDMNPLIVTGSDKNYFEVQWSFLRSLKYFEETRHIDCIVIDAGLTPEQKARLESIGVKSAEVGWGFPFMDSFDIAKLPQHLKCLTARPFLPSMLPGYSHYIWMDADTWIQSGKSVGVFLEAAKDADLVIVPELHHTFEYLYHTNNASRASHRFIYNSCYGKETGDILSMLPVHNAGVFAAKAESPLWSEWSREMGECVMRARFLNCDQASLNSLIYNQKLTAARLPAEFNWVCSSQTPEWDRKEGIFVSPGPLARRIEVMHVTGAALSQKWHDIRCRQGGTVQRSLLSPFPQVVPDSSPAG